MPVGVCPCGAVYALDVTGHNLGAAFIEALVFACNLDWDLAWGLLPEDDYRETIAEHYDPATNLLVPGLSREGRRVPGALYFVRLHDDVQEVAAPRRPPAPAPRPGKTTLTTGEVEELVRAWRIAPLLAPNARPKKLVRDVWRLLWAADELLRRRAAEILGLLAGADPDAGAGLLERLFSTLADPGAFCPGALDAAGQIIAHSPRSFTGFVPALMTYLEDAVHRPAALRALARIAAVRPAALPRQAAHLGPYLRDPHPATRAFAALVLGGVKAAAAREDLEALRDDPAPVDFYADGVLQQKTVGELAAAALLML